MKIFLFYDSDDSIAGVVKESLEEAFEAFSANLKKQDTEAVESDEITLSEDKQKAEQKITYKVKYADHTRHETYTIKYDVTEVESNENGVFFV